MNSKTMGFESVCKILGRFFGQEKNELEEFAPLLDALESGASVLVAGRPASGKTSFLAALLVNNPDALVLCGSRKAADVLNQQALRMRSIEKTTAGSLGICKSFSSEIFARLNAWREANKLPPVRLATDAELFAEVKGLLSEIDVDEDLHSALETQGFLKDLIDGIFRVRSLGTDSSPNRVHPLVKELIELMKEDRFKKRRLAREEAWPLDTASLYEEYLLALEDGAPSPDFVGLDDWQNANGLMTEIVLSWAKRGTQIIAMSLPQASVNAFRGGTEKSWEELRVGLEKIPGGKVAEVILPKMFVPRKLKRLWRAVISRMGVHGIGTKLWAPGEDDADLDIVQAEDSEYDSEIILVEESGDYEQFREISRILQEKHLFSESGIPYENMAVLTRTLSDAKTMAEVLGTMGIPASIPGSTEQLNEGRMTYWLLKMMQLVCTEEPLEKSAGKIDLPGLLGSALFGMDTWKIRSLELGLGDIATQSISESLSESEESACEKSEGLGVNPSSTLAKESSEEEFLATEMLGFTRAMWRATLSDSLYFGKTAEEIVRLLPDSKIIVKTAVALRDARAQWEKEPESIQLILWKIWDGINRGDKLRDLALSSVLDWQVRDLIQIDLDLVMDLVKAADWFEARNPGRTAADFAQSMLERDLPTGTVAPHHLSPGAVTVSTASSAVSRHWEIVAVAGLTEGNWPSLRWPGSLLGTAMFDLEASTKAQSDEEEPYQAGFQWGWQNEFKNFFAAVTRTRKTLILGTTQGNGSSPSPFLSAVEKAPELRKSKNEMSRLPSNLRDFTAYLRSVTMKTDGGILPSEDTELGFGDSSVLSEPGEAASLLATLAQREYGPAQPRNWLGVLRPPQESRDDEVRIRASGFEKALWNPLDYILGWNGFADQEEDDMAASKAGTIVHEAARTIGERYWLKGKEIRTDLTPEEILGELEKEVSKWLPESQTAAGDNFQRKVKVCLPPLANFMADNQYPSLFEYSCFGRIPNRDKTGVITYGAVIDRVIFSPNGTQIVDYKTGSPSQFNAKSVGANLQLMLYQKAFNDSKEGKKHPCKEAVIVTLKNPPQSPLVGETELKDLQPGMFFQSGDWKTTITIPEPFSATHRQLLEDPEAWLAGKKPADGDPETMKMCDYLQDRVDLAVKAFGGPRLARLVFPDEWGSHTTLNLEVQGK